MRRECQNRWSLEFHGQWLSHPLALEKKPLLLLREAYLLRLLFTWVIKLLALCLLIITIIVLKNARHSANDTLSLLIQRTPLIGCCLHFIHEENEASWQAKCSGYEDRLWAQIALGLGRLLCTIPAHLALIITPPFLDCREDFEIMHVNI